MSVLSAEDSGIANSIAEDVVHLVTELDDRTSPEDQPEMLLVTGEELHGFVLLAIERYWERCASSAGGKDE